MHSVLVNSEYFSGTFSLHLLQTSTPNTSSHTWSISRLLHSAHFFLFASSSRTLNPGSNGPAFNLRRFFNICIRSHS